MNIGDMVIVTGGNYVFTQKGSYGRITEDLGDEVTVYFEYITHATPFMSSRSYPIRKDNLTFYTNLGKDYVPYEDRNI